MDLLTTRADGTYRKFENGKSRTRDADYLRRIGQILKLSEGEYTQLYLLTFRHAPARPLNPQAGMTVPDVWRRVVDGQRDMAYVTNVQWDLLYCNDAFRALFARGEPPENTMRWMMLSEEARRVNLTDWATRWAPFVLPQLRAAYIAYPDNAVIRQLHEDVLADDATGPIYRQKTEPYIQPDGDRRPLNHALFGPGMTTIAGAEPLGSRGSRLIILPWDPATPESAS
ncbi:XRE family transcriptional regulator (plasmid) [Streptomyces sp. NBC_01471]|uniref:MmyB family transcriptional regulator n=1 Tax=Streptomyces sp. NBC_01471 TaxID=2903879 RepID=UPI002F917FB2